MSKLKMWGLVALILVAVGSSLQALPVGGSWTIYYSDATLETVVGENYHGCDSSERWGDISDYSETETWACATGESTGCSATVCLARGEAGQCVQTYEWSCATW